LGCVCWICGPPSRVICILPVVSRSRLQSGFSLPVGSYSLCSARGITPSEGIFPYLKTSTGLCFNITSFFHIASCAKRPVLIFDCPKVGSMDYVERHSNISAVSKLMNIKVFLAAERCHTIKLFPRVSRCVFFVSFSHARGCRRTSPPRVARVPRVRSQLMPHSRLDMRCRLKTLPKSGVFV